MASLKLPHYVVWMIVGTLTLAISAAAEPLPQPNALLNLSPPMTEQQNSAVAFSSASMVDVLAVWTEFPPGYLFPFPGTGTMVNWRWSPNSGATWTTLGTVPFSTGWSEWNPAIADMDASFGPSRFVVVDAAYAPRAWWLGSANRINAYQTPVAGTPFLFWATVATNTVGSTWVDYPNIAIDDFTGSPCLGRTHIAWVEYADGTAGDADGNGNFFDDAGDGFRIMFTNTIPPAPPPPGIPLFGGAVFPNELAACRPSIAIMPPGFGNINVGPGGMYVAWTDGMTAGLAYSASCTPIVFSAPVPVRSTPGLVPPVIAPGINCASNATVAIGQGLTCPGWVFLAWAEMNGPDIDIFFSRSPNGSFGTWSPPIMVNQVKRGDQWEPKMTVTPNNGIIKIVYLDRRNDPGNVLVETWVSASRDCGNTWTDCQLSQQAPPLSTFGVPPAPFYIGDYLGSDVPRPGLSGYTWNDGRFGSDQDVWFDNQCCDCTPGDANADGTIDISDAVYLITFIFASGLPPTPYALCSGDANCDCAVDISDVVYLINYIFGGGPAPCNCFTWAANCGPLQ